MPTLNPEGEETVVGGADKENAGVGGRRTPRGKSRADEVLEHKVNVDACQFLVSSVDRAAALRAVDDRFYSRRGGR